MAPIVFPLLVKTLVDYLSSTEPQAILANCPVASETPNPRPVRYIALLTVPVGGPQRAGILATRRISVQLDDASPFLVGTLAETVCGLLVDTKYQGLGIKSVNVIGNPAGFPGPGQPNRWQITADFLIRAKASVL
jgi:hypothetical protein